MSKEVRQVLARPEVRERFLEEGVEPVGMSPGEAVTYIKTDIATTARLVPEAGIRLER